MRHKTLYFCILAGVTLLFVASLGSGPWNQPVDYTSWPYRLFHGICHQMPERSFQINGIPMAVNSRCFGIFAGVAAAWYMIPLVANRLKGFQKPGILLAFAVALQIFDYASSQLEIWNSSNNLRFCFGLVLGVAVVTTLANQFQKSEY